MKALLGMAREKRENAGQPQDFKPLSKLNLRRQEPEPEPSSYLEEDDEDYEPDEEQIIAYAEYLGIQLPEEEDLLFIAREGLMADLPPDWTNEEADDGNIIYTNLRTGQKTFEHPCDEYYRALVIKERRKMGPAVNKYAAGVQPIGMSMQQPPKKDIDPLVKMEIEKKKKKFEEQKKKQFEDSRREIKQRYQEKKDEYEKELKEKQQKAKKKFEQEIQNQRHKVQKKMTEKERDQQEKNRKELEKFQRETRARLEKKLHDQISLQREKIVKKMKEKREEIRINLQNDLKKAKKELEQQQKTLLHILVEKDKAISVKKNEQELIDEEKEQIKNQFIKKQMERNSTQIDAEKAAQEEQYKTKVAKMEHQYEEKTKQLETEAPKHQIKFDGIIKEIEEEEREQLKSFEYELEMLRELKKAENEEALQRVKAEFWQTQREQLNQLDRQKQEAIEKFRRVKEQEFLSRLGEQQKKAKQQYLNSLKVLRQKFEREEEVIQMEGRGKKSDRTLEKQSLEMMEQSLEKLNWREEKLREDIESLRSSIRQAGKRSRPVEHKLTEEQLRMYQFIKDCMTKRGEGDM